MLITSLNQLLIVTMMVVQFVYLEPFSLRQLSDMMVVSFTAD